MNRGIMLILLSYLIWGCFPIYWSLLNHVNPSEVLFHRVIWSLPILFYSLLQIKLVEKISRILYLPVKSYCFWF